MKLPWVPWKEARRIEVCYKTNNKFYHTIEELYRTNAALFMFISYMFFAIKSNHACLIVNIPPRVYKAGLSIKVNHDRCNPSLNFLPTGLSALFLPTNRTFSFGYQLAFRMLLVGNCGSRPFLYRSEYKSVTYIPLYFLYFILDCLCWWDTAYCNRSPQPRQICVDLPTACWALQICF